MDRRSFLKLAALGTAGSVLDGCTPGKSVVETAQGASRPNFVVIIGDDISWADCGAYGHPTIRTPNVDRLAHEGIKFTHAFLTTSSCAPSRAGIMTGRYPHNTDAGNLSLQLGAEQVVFPTLLREAGYYNAGAGKWHLGAARNSFDVVVEGGPSGCERWLEILRNRPKDKPFFLWLGSRDAHLPYRAGTIDKPHKPQDAVVPPFLPDVAETRQDLAMYYDEISRLDAYVGEVLEELRAQRDCFLAPRPAEELYDLEKDPHSINNIVGEPEYYSVLVKMRSELDGWIKRAGDKVPDNPLPDRFDRLTGRLLQG